MIEPLLDEPDRMQLEVGTTDGGTVTTIELYLSSGDYGKIVGRRGRTYAAFRKIFSILGYKRRHRYVLEVIDSDR